MEYTRLGASGLEVSELCLGCMGFGAGDDGPHGWSVDESASRPIIEAALEHGINFFDTANAYSRGSSEEIVGRVLGDLADRPEVVIATKVFFPMRRGRNAGGLSRKAIMTEVDASLRRLGTDYIDLYQIHRFDPNTPVEETMRALHDVVESGKARYLGASSMWAWQFATMQHVAAANGWTPFISMQNQHSLLMREDERELLPLCADLGVGSIPWSPLARGLLAREPDAQTERSESDPMIRARFDPALVRPIIDRVGEVAAARNVPRSHVAMAWVRQHPVVASPIVGATKLHHVTDAVDSLTLELTHDERALLEEPYPVRPSSF